MRPEILTHSGNYFNFEAPEKSVFTMLDIAHGLANKCRFAGHTREFYSVAQHSVLVSRVVPPSFSLAGLLHDAAEAFVSDIPTPLKALLPDYQEVERKVERAVFARCGVRYPLPSCVKVADLVLLATERRDLMPETADEWELIAGVVPLDDEIQPQPPKVAERAFLQRYYELMAEAVEVNA